LAKRLELTSQEIYSFLTLGLEQHLLQRKNNPIKIVTTTTTANPKTNLGFRKSK
jgi:hypothetical protein